MKFLSILAAASLAFAPVIASAGSSGDNSNDGRPISGPLAGRALPASVVPATAIVVGGLVLVGGAVVALLGGDNNNANSTIDTITTTTTTSN